MVPLRSSDINSPQIPEIPRTSGAGSPKNLAKGEYGSKSAWADVDSRAAAPPTVRQQYERISELLVTMGAEEVFPDAVALLRWRDRNQRMLPKLALDGIATRDSCEQLIHCLQSGGEQLVLLVGFGGRCSLRS